MENVLINKATKAVVQGITGKVGRAQTHWMVKAGKLLAAGVTPGKGGQEVEGLPVYNTVGEAVEKQCINASVIFVPPLGVVDAVNEALNAGIRLIVIITEYVPLRDTIFIRHRAKQTGAWIIGPNCPGLFVPGLGKLGIMPESIFQKGNIGVIGRSATLSYEVIGNLTDAGFGQTAAVGIGGDPVICTEFKDILPLFENDPATEAVVMVCEIGGSAEERSADVIASMTKPVVALVSGRSLPPGKQFGHAGAIVSEVDGNAEKKIKTLQNAGAKIADTPRQIPIILSQLLAERKSE
jgi:succinyl-CoA synthetase alpha subunit